MKTILFLLTFFIATTALSQNKTDEEKTYSKLYNDGTALIGEKKFKEALQLFNDAIALKKTSAEAIFARGTCYLMLNERDKACVDFNTAKTLKLPASEDYIKKYCGNDSPGRTQKPLNNK